MKRKKNSKKEKLKTSHRVETTWSAGLFFVICNSRQCRQTWSSPQNQKSRMRLMDPLYIASSRARCVRHVLFSARRTNANTTKHMQASREKHFGCVRSTSLRPARFAGREKTEELVALQPHIPREFSSISSASTAAWALDNLLLCGGEEQAALNNRPVVGRNCVVFTYSCQRGTTPFRTARDESVC